MKRFVMTAMFIALAVGGYGAWWWWQQSGAAAAVDKGGAGKGGRGGALAVKAVAATVRPMPVVIEAVGTVEPEHSVQVRAQVSGVLQSVLFKEGDKVQAGQLLFEIDPRTFQASYNQAQAQLARDQAQLENARVQRDRLEPLLKREFITQQEFDVAVTSTKSLEATVAADHALLEQARIQLEFSRIRAPIAGRTGALAIRPGNLVPTAGGGVPLVTINSTDPILATFSIPERQLEELRRHENEKEMRIEILPDRNLPAVAEGKLVFIDNTITPQTGTVVLKTRAGNKSEILWPGQFVNVRIILKIEPAAVVVPESAVQPGQDGSFVYLIDEESRVQVRPVKVARQIGGDVVIASGVRGGDRVITEIPQALQEGARVRISGTKDTVEAGKADSNGKKARDKGAGSGNAGPKG
jgi:RND family efflux transporter MFP subunit